MKKDGNWVTRKKPIKQRTGVRTNWFCHACEVGGEQCAARFYTLHNMPRVVVHIVSSSCRTNTITIIWTIANPTWPMKSKLYYTNFSRQWSHIEIYHARATKKSFHQEENANETSSRKLHQTVSKTKLRWTIRWIRKIRIWWWWNWR